MVLCTRRVQSPGSVTGDTHAANLTGSYSASSDTHAASLTGSYTASSDSHAVTSDSSNNSALAPGANSVSVGVFSNDTTTVETTVTNSSITVTPGNATNQTTFAAYCLLLKLTNAGTITMRIKESASTITSFTTASIAINNFADGICFGTVANVSAASHTYTVTIQAATTGARAGPGCNFVKVVTLTGSYSASSDTHAASLTGTYTASSDTHAAQLTGSSGTCQ